MHPKLLSTAPAVTLLALLSAVTLLAQTPTSPAPLPSPPPINHEFDFWLGEWQVTTPDGKAAGTSRIESVAEGHGLLENWTGDPAAGGGNGKSLNCYNLGTRQWQQFWIGSRGGVLELAGGLHDGSMVLSGSHTVRGQSLWNGSHGPRKPMVRCGSSGNSRGMAARAGSRSSTGFTARNNIGRVEDPPDVISCDELAA